LIKGYYKEIIINNKKNEIYYETAGEGVPLICLHTAGGDSRQFKYLLRNKELTSKFQIIAFDLPFHGRSFPPDKWWEKQYFLSTDLYIEIIEKFVQSIEVESPLIMGCSMGGSITLELAYRYPKKYRGVIALEAAEKTSGRFNDYLFHPRINGGEMCASNIFELTSPYSPEKNRRESWWIYSQGAPGIYYGDLYFYSEEWDATDRVQYIDTQMCPVHLLTGEYDYSCTPEMTKQTAKKIKGAYYKRMEKIGHFPMIENPELFLEYLRPVLKKYQKDN